MAAEKCLGEWKSPWKIRSAASPAVVDDSEWPALSKHNGKRRLDHGCIDPTVVGDCCGDSPRPVPVILTPAPAAKVDDDGPHKGRLNGGGGTTSIHHHQHKRPPTMHHNHIHTTPHFNTTQASLPPQYYYHPSIPTPPTTNYNFYFQAPTNFINGPNLPDSAYYFQPTPSGWVKVPYPQLPPPPPLPYPQSPLYVPPPPAPLIALKASIVKQIEYYFCDENLQDDYYLKSLMDDQGWVSVTKISEFRMIKRLKVDIPLIVDALQASQTIQVEGQMIRRRNDWQKWLPTSVSRIFS